MTNLDNVLKSRDITLPTKVPIYVWIWRLDHKKAEHQELMLSNSGAGEDSWEFMDSKQIKPVKPIGNQPWIFIGVSDAEAEAQILCFFLVSKLSGKDHDAGKDWRQEEKGVSEDEMFGWHHRLNGHEFEQTLGDSEGQGAWSALVYGFAESEI